ncbi:MAG TPA: GNAT family N-acetyltransferase [Aeromicrobium sp.]|nr:GNAT family N-acetyltransferase [Aeromicrobium sp.]
MLGTTTGVRGLTADDLASVRALLDRDPGVNVFLRYRVDSTALRDRVVGPRVWGYFDGPELVAACHAGSNIVPAEAGTDAVEAFAGHVLTEGIRPASIAGLQSAVLPLWERLAPFLGQARSIRPVQPFLALDDEPQVAPDTRVRRVTMDELDLLYPACVSMFREEVGIDPEASGGHGYRARVAQLISQGWAFAIVEGGEILFKTEVGAASPHACQLQGVWVRPDRRGEDISAAALAQVIRLVRRDVAPLVTLYVNDHNVSARALYRRVGFTEQATFASILL